jgi:hypothetical protein
MVVRGAGGEQGTLKGRDVVCADTAPGGRPCEGLPPGSIIHREAAAQRAGRIAVHRHTLEPVDGVVEETIHECAP